jgi:serine protease Do/serine protease DegQ
MPPPLSRPYVDKPLGRRIIDMCVTETTERHSATGISFLPNVSYRSVRQLFAPGFRVLSCVVVIGLASANAAAVDQPSLAPMLERVLPSVVSIVVRGGEDAKDDSSSEDAAPFTQSEATGSGVIVDAANGYILTNDHVVENAAGISVRLSNGNAYDGAMIGADPETDLAVLQIKVPGLVAMRLGNSTKLRVGDYVTAIGNPFGLGQTVTLGIVSALNRDVDGLDGYGNFIQTDASINPGNSGGALVNLDGELVGINSALIGPSDGNVGIGFAVPIDMAKDVMMDLIAGGEVRHGQLGVAVQDNNTDFQQALVIKTATGALVGEVAADSAAAKAGVRTADVIVGVNSLPIRTAAELRMKIASFRPGAMVTLSIIRSEGKVDLAATLTSVSLSKRAPAPIAIDGEGLLALVALQSLGADSAAYGKVEGAFVASLSDRSKASTAGLSAGDVIVSVDRRPAKSPEMVVGLARRDKNLLLLGIFRDGRKRFLIVK